MGGELISLRDELSALTAVGLCTQLVSYHPVIQDFQNLIEQDAKLYKLFQQMFNQIPNEPPYLNDPSGKPQIRDYKTMLAALNIIIRRAPSFDKCASAGAKCEVPICYIFEWPMGTLAGNAVFHHPKVNTQIRKILNEWARFLGSSGSTYTLNNDKKTGWFGEEAMAAMPNFATNFVCDPHAPHFGFKSWDDFFTRLYRPGIRPIVSPEDGNVIINACESAPYRISRNVKERDTFWLKEQPYSLHDIFANDPLTSQFVGGTIYQANLGSLNYHRWHSPVSGTIKKAYVVPGSYYAESLIQGFDEAGPDHSLAYITQVATRALVFIEADNSAIGLLCFMAIGIVEISTCAITVHEGQNVKKGDEIGMFHFGGSSYCLILRPEVNVDFDLRGQTPSLEADNIAVNATLANVANGP